MPSASPEISARKVSSNISSEDTFQMAKTSQGSPLQIYYLNPALNLSFLARSLQAD